MDVGEFIEGLRAQGQEEAYWQALGRVFGPATARVLKALLLAKVPADDRADWQRVAQGLAELLQWQARAVETLARHAVPVGEPRPWMEALASLGPHDHVLHFEEGGGPRGTVDFLSSGLERGATVVCGCPGREAAAIERALADRGHGEQLEAGRLTVVALDGLAEASEAEGSIGPALEGLREGGLGAALEGTREVWVNDNLSSLLYLHGHRNLAMELEAWWHRQGREQPLVLRCSFPAERAPEPGDLLSLARSHTWVACGQRAFPMRMAPP